MDIRIPDQRTDDADRQGMDLLAAHVPLTLLIDLAEAPGPASDDILDNERPAAAELAWLVASR